MSEKTITEDNNEVVPFGGDVPSVEFEVSEFKKAYFINGSYATRNPDGSIRTPTNDFDKLKR